MGQYFRWSVDHSIFIILPSLYSRMDKPPCRWEIRIKKCAGHISINPKGRTIERLRILRAKQSNGDMPNTSGLTSQTMQACLAK
ncbi:hypothetical protein A3766_23445 [Oleiphilus sp. HI0132]|nr:hypothetical protein A3766_23445 [Oleiphilus sp. HI0132]